MLYMWDKTAEEGLGAQQRLARKEREAGEEREGMRGSEYTLKSMLCVREIVLPKPITTYDE